MLDKRLMKEIKGNKAYITMLVLYGLCTFAFAFSTAYILSNIVNDIFMGGKTLSQKYPWLIVLSFVVLLRAVLTFFYQRYFRRVAGLLKNKILVGAVEDLLHRGPVATKNQASGDMITSWTEAMEHIEPFYSEYLPQFFALVITVPCLLVIAFAFDTISALIMLVTGPILPFFLSLIGYQSREANEKRLKGLGKLGDSMMDFLNGIRTIKMFDGTKRYRKLIDASSEEFRVLTMQVLRIAFLSAFVLEFAATISTAMIAVSLGVRLMYGSIIFHNAFLILLITPDYYMAIRSFGSKFHTAMGAKAAADCLYRRGSAIKQLVSEGKASPVIKEAVDIELRGISYQYPDNNSKALDGVSMSISKNRITAIVGKSGSGKSTLVYAIMRYINAEGTIYFDHYDMTEGNLSILRSMIAYIPQRPYIFQDTLRNNLIKVRPGLTDGDLFTALDKASLRSFVMGLPEGLDTVLTETGANISVGEAQRLAFARAYLKDCPIIIIDEGTSALDEENEQLIRSAFEELSKNKTVLVIAHRLATVKDAEMIYVMENGQVTEAGNHTSLLLQNGIYKELVETWGVTM